MGKFLLSILSGVVLSLIVIWISVPALTGNVIYIPADTQTCEREKPGVTVCHSTISSSTLQHARYCLEMKGKALSYEDWKGCQI